MKYLLFSIAFLLCSSYAFSQDHQLELKASSGGIMLRWFPADFDTWLKGMQEGFEVERATDEPNYNQINTSPIKPQLPSDSRAGYLLQQIIAHQDSVSDWRKRPNGEQLLSGLYREYCRAIASEEKGIPNSGLFYYDRTAKTGQQYSYRVRINKGNVLASNNSKMAQQLKFPELGIEDMEGLFHFVWYQEKDPAHFQAFRLERSVDANTFSSVSPDWQYPVAYAAELNVKRDTFLMRDSVAVSKSYFYRLRGMDAFGDALTGPVSKVSSRDITPPAPPVEFTAKPIKENKQVLLSWEKSDRETDFVGYHIYRSTSPRGDYVRITSSPLAVQTNSYVDRSMSNPQGVYYYQVAVVDKSNNEAQSFRQSAVFHDKTPPATPSGLSATINPKGIVQINWQDNTEADLAGYVLHTARYTEDEFVPRTQNVIPKAFFEDTLALNFQNREYYYKVAALDHFGNLSAFSPGFKIMLPDTIAPIVPILHKPHRLEKDLLLTWQAGQGEDLAYCEVFLKQSSATNWTSIYQTKTASEDTITVPNPPAGSWQLSVQAVDQSGNRSPLSNVRHVLMEEEEAVQQRVQNLRQRKDIGPGIVLDWDYPLLKENFAFMVLRRNLNEGGPRLIATVSETTFSDLEVKEGQNYEYHIIVQSQKGQYSAPSISLQVNY